MVTKDAGPPAVRIDQPVTVKPTVDTRTTAGLSLRAERRAR